MTDTTDTPGLPGPGGRIEPVELQVEMQRSYIDYAMTVIVGRALPDVRDGLKPVHRRVLYAMYDGGSQEPTILPSRFPNLLVNGSAGIAVGMATNIPPHNLREIADGVQWALAHPEASNEELLDALLARVKGPDFPTKGLIVGRHGIEQAYRTGRGSVTMRAVVDIDEDSR